MTILITASLEPGGATTAQTRELISSLASTNDVEVWTPEGQAAIDLPVRVRPVNPDDPQAAAAARNFDEVIHVTSGSITSAPIAAFARGVPGVVIVHDLSLLQALHEQVINKGGRSEHLVELVRILHGPGVASQLEMSFISPGTGVAAPELQQAAPAASYFLNAATAVVTHSGWAAQRLANTLPVPVLTAPLPSHLYEGPGAGARGPRAPVVIPGPVALHTLTATAISGYAASGLAERGHDLIVLGPCDARMTAHLRITAHREGVDDHVTFITPPGADHLLATLAEALAIVTLRQHDTEAQSVAVLAGMTSGRPVVATDAGSTGDIPDDLLIKVPDDGAGPVAAMAVAKALRTIADDPVLADEMAARAAAWVRARHTLAGYVSVVREGLAIHQRRVPEVDTALQMTDRLITSGLITSGLITSDAAITACADALASLGS